MCTTISNSINLFIFLFHLQTSFLIFFNHKQRNKIFFFFHVGKYITSLCHFYPRLTLFTICDIFYNIYFYIIRLLTLYVLCNFLSNMFKHKRAIWFHYFEYVCLPWPLGCSIYTMILICLLYVQPEVFMSVIVL